MGLMTVLANIVDPFSIMRSLIIRPALEMTLAALDHYKSKTKESVMSARDTVLRIGIVLSGIILIVWAAIFLYIAFYYTYMPAIAHVRPVHLQIENCETSQGKQSCPYPSAQVSLTKKQQLLMVGQPYKVFVNIEMPETPQNEELGMFMVCAAMRDNAKELRGESCRSTMLHYRSPLLRTLNTFLLSPFLVFGIREEKQQIPVELFSNYEDDQSHPVTQVYVQIKSHKVQYYSITLHITAHFTGLRYIMFHWPILSAALGISTNLFFIMMVCLLSWYHWSDTAWIDEAKERYQKIKLLRKRIGNRSENELSTSIDASRDILDDDDISIIDELKSEDGNESLSRKISRSGHDLYDDDSL